MQTSIEKLNTLSGNIVVVINKDDYNPLLDQRFKELKSKVNLPGFRKGHVPISVIKKLTGNDVLAEEIQKILQKEIESYIQEEKLDLLGYPIPRNDNPSIDIKNLSDYTFKFEVGFAPEFEVNLNEKLKINAYEVKIDEKDIEKELENLRLTYGETEEIEKVENDKSLLFGELRELGKDENSSEPALKKETAVRLEKVNNFLLKRKLKKAKKGDIIKLNIFKLYNDRKAFMAQLFNISTKQVEDLNKDFEFEIKTIKKSVLAEINQEFYNKVFGEGKVDSTEDLNEGIAKNLESYYKREAEYRLNKEIEDLLITEFTFELPEEFLKKWLLETKPDRYTEENIDNLFQNEAKSLRMQLIREKIAKKYEFKISEEEFNNASKEYIIAIFSYYGMKDFDHNVLAAYEAEQLKDPKYIDRINDIVLNKLVINKVKEHITTKTKEMSAEKYDKMLEDLIEKEQLTEANV